MGKPCRQKTKFKTLLAARAFANKYMEDIVLTFYPMKAFYCLRHNCYHVGHDRYFEKGVDKNSEPGVN